MTAFIKLIGLLSGLVLLAGCATEVGVTYYDPFPPVYYGWYGGYYGPYYWNGPVVVYGHPHRWHGNYHGGPRYVAPPPPHRVIPAPAPRVTPAPTTPPPNRVVPQAPRGERPVMPPRGNGNGGPQHRQQGPPQRP
jgi:hypothetical protein